MRHKYKGRKLGTDWSHTQAMKRSLVQALFLNDRIKTTETRAKEIRRDVDKIITWAKRGDLHSRRLAIAALGNDKDLTREIFEKVSQGMFEGRPGGYTRIMKLGPRKGDGAPMVIMELITDTCVPKAQKQASSKATPKKKAAPKKVTKEAKEEVAEEEKKNEASEESVIDEIKDSIEAAEENFAEEVQEEGKEQLEAEEKEAAKDKASEEAKEAEKIREEQFKAEAKSALEAEGKGPNIQEMPESVEKA